MANSKHIHVGELGSAMENTLELYAQDVQDAIVDVTETWMKTLVRKTKETAPRGRRNGQYRKNITADYRELRRVKSLRGRTIRATWYVKAPDHRLTHLLVHGHATKDGGRTRANPFLQNAVDFVIPEYEHELEEVLRNGK